MGIPAFYSWLSQKYRRITRKEIPAIHNLYVDLNGLIHVACQQLDGSYGGEEEDMLIKLVAYLEKVITATNPSRLIYIAVDGVAPRAKLNQQRGRRFQSSHNTEAELNTDCFGEDADHGEHLSAHRELEEVRETLNLGIFSAQDLNAEEPDQDDDESPCNLFTNFSEDDPITGNTWDGNAITPGTPFMTKVAETMKVWASKKVSQPGNTVSVIVSDSNRPGEGEHKFIDFMRAETQHPDNDPNQRHAVASLDADIILLSLSLHIPNVYVVREDRRVTPSFSKFEFCHIDYLREYLAEELLGKITKYANETHAATHPLLKKHKLDFERILTDFIFLITLCGNDFLPHLPAAYVGQLTGDLIIDLYCRCLVAEAPLDAVCHPHIVNEDGSVDQANFMGVIEMYAIVEDAQFRGQAVYEGLVTEDLVKSQGAAAGDKVWRKTYYDSINDITSAFNVHMQPEDGAHAWLEGILWVNYYYNNIGALSWSWYYPFYHAPMARDIVSVLKKKPDLINNLTLSIKRSKFAAVPLQPKQQLIAVLPKSSFSLIPEQFHKFATSQEDKYPSSWPLDLTGCRAEYHGLPVIPFLDVVKLISESSHTIPKENTDDGDSLFIGSDSFVLRNHKTDSKGSKCVLSETYVHSPGARPKNVNHPKCGIAVEYPKYVPWRPKETSPGVITRLSSVVRALANAGGKSKAAALLVVIGCIVCLLRKE
eukprot:TRINITY_DN714_c4_g1_i1.p1 TRINITY_DN714_c4_g1~~TRINITY_DN714_c4_g1_i1.p1  ORF type:complete len:720 (+),score=122.54 TRINITY_DN714_c4_g1_i1:39-2162(+)